MQKVTTGRLFEDFAVGQTFGTLAVDYKLALNVLGLVVFAALLWLTQRRGVTDPVCGMKVDRLKALRKDYMGGVHFFCSQGCLETFAREPETYAGRSAEGGGRAAPLAVAGDASTERVPADGR